jgi:hypothetical protein
VDPFDDETRGAASFRGSARDRRPGDPDAGETEQVPVQAFVVGVDGAAVLSRRETVRKAQQRGALITAVIGGVGILLAIAALVAFRGVGLWPFALLLILSMVPLVLSTVQARRLAAARERWYAANGLPTVAMRLSPKGLELACDGAESPVILPWTTTRGFKQEMVFGQVVLNLVLAPGAGATTAGVRGLDQAAVRALVKPSPLLKPVGMFGVATLDQPVHIIDQALHHFSTGRAGIAR